MSSGQAFSAASVKSPPSLRYPMNIILKSCWPRFPLAHLSLSSWGIVLTSELYVLVRVWEATLKRVIGVGRMKIYVTTTGWYVVLVMVSGNGNRIFSTDALCYRQSPPFSPSLVTPRARRSSLFFPVGRVRSIYGTLHFRFLVTGLFVNVARTECSVQSRGSSRGS